MKATQWSQSRGILSSAVVISTIGLWFVWSSLYRLTNCRNQPVALAMFNARDILKFFAGVATGWFAHIFAGRRDAKIRVRNAKEEFLAIVAAQWAWLDGLGRQDYMHFHPNEDAVLKESVEAMTIAVFRAQPYLTMKERAWVATVLTEFQAHAEQYTEVTGGRLHEKSGVSLVQRLQAYMQRFAECIHQ